MAAIIGQSYERDKVPVINLDLLSVEWQPFCYRPVLSVRMVE